MNTIFVAKSYQDLPKVGEVFFSSGKSYINVRLKNGNIKTVRTYTEKEFARMYPEEKVPAASPDRKTQKDILGFEKGYITIFKGDTYANLEWFKRSIARYCKFWGWYIVSTDELPEDMPTTVTPIQLAWELVGREDGNLLPEGQVAAAIETLLYEPTPSEFQGVIGERLEKVLTVRKNICLQGAFGVSTMHIFEDADQNVYVWTTASKSWPEGSEHRVRGTVKDHRIYKNCKQTVLTRCVSLSGD